MVVIERGEVITTHQHIESKIMSKYDYREDQVNDFKSDISKGWIPCDPDTEQRALLIDSESQTYVIRQTSTSNKAEYVEEEIDTSSIDESEIQSLIGAYGYSDDIRQDESFPLLLAEMQFETNNVI